MKFGVLQFFSWPERRTPLATVYDRAIERVKIMDAGGYDAVWLAEHHFSSYSVCPSVHIMGMHLAHLTKNIRIGTAVSLAAFYHPLRLAEELALLDNLSGGRINAGFGRGFDRTEMDIFGVSLDESYDRFRENIDIVLNAWTTERLTYHGKFNSYDSVEVLPKPAQNPMPTWIAASSPAAVEWAAQQGHAILMDPHSTHREIAEKYQTYRSTVTESGLSNRLDTPVARLLSIAATDAEAEAIARQGAQWTVGSYADPKKGGPPSNLNRDELVDRYVNDVIIHGSPAKVVEQLTELEQTMPLNYLLASILSHETFLRLTDEVIPKMQ